MATDHTEKRAHKRVPLDMPLFIMLKIPDARELPVQMLNCSRGGVKLGFAPKDETLSRGMLNSRVRLMDLPRSMDPVDTGRGGKVAWVSSGKCGVRFDEPLLLTDGEIKDIAYEL